MATVERSKPSNNSRLIIATCVILVDVCLVRAQTVRVPGTAVTMIPSPGFSAARDYPGVEHVELQSSIVVTEMPAPLSATKGGLTADLASKGIVLLDSKAVTAAGRESLLVKAVQRVGEAEFRKWMLVGGDDTRTVMIVATFPITAGDALNVPLVRSLLTASWVAESVPYVFEGLLFQVTPSPRLKIAARMTNILLLNESGIIEPPGTDQAFYLVGNSLGKVDAGDLKALSELRARQVKHFKDLRNMVLSTTQLDGLKAYEIVADATDAKTGKNTKFYQVLAADGSGYFLIQGFVLAERASEMVGEFRRVTATFRRVQ